MSRPAASAGRGAHASLSGRAWVYGLAAQGGRGVKTVLDIIDGALRDRMSLGGFTDVHAIPARFVTPQPPL